MAKKPTPKKVVKSSNKPAAKAVKKPHANVAKKAVRSAPKKVATPAKKTSQSSVKKASPKKTIVKTAVAKKTVSKKIPSTKEVRLSSSSKGKKATKHKIIPGGNGALRQKFLRKPAVNKNLKLSPFLTKQRKRLLDLKDILLDSMNGVARGNLHAGSETSAFGMHQADAGSDAYDRDFALSMLSKEQGSLYEIDEALKRINDGTYGLCEICEKPIRRDRLEALPFTRYTVDCQSELEKRQHHSSVRPHINSLFGLTEEESESEEEETAEAS